MSERKTYPSNDVHKNCLDEEEQYVQYLLSDDGKVILLIDSPIDRFSILFRNLD